MNKRNILIIIFAVLTVLSIIFIVWKKDYFTIVVGTPQKAGPSDTNILLWKDSKGEHYLHGDMLSLLDLAAPVGLIYLIFFYREDESSKK
jgi:hypothetical protein